MKKLFISAIASLGLLAASVTPAHAQADAKWILGQGTTTNNVAAASTNTYAADISVPKSANFSLSIGLKFSTATSNSVAACVFKPVDGFGNVSTIASQAVTINVAENGTNQVYSVTNFTANAIPVWRLTSISNTNGAGYYTNVTVRIVSKNGI